MTTLPDPSGRAAATFIRSQMSQQTLMHPTERFVPLHFYLLHALDLMYDHVREGNALPPSQVISTAPHGRGDSAADRSRHASSADRGGAASCRAYRIQRGEIRHPGMTKSVAHCCITGRA